MFKETFAQYKNNALSFNQICTAYGIRTAGALLRLR
jgi:hypothetical protein